MSSLPRDLRRAKHISAMPEAPHTGNMNQVDSLSLEGKPMSLELRIGSHHHLGPPSRREARIRVSFFSVVYFSTGALPQIRAKALLGTSHRVKLGVFFSC